MKNKQDFKKDLEVIVKQLEEGTVDREWIKNNYDVPKATRNRWLNKALKQITKKPTQKQVSRLKKSESASEPPKKLKLKNKRSKSKQKKRSIDQEKQLIEYQELAKYLVVNKLANIYKNHFGNKTMRVTKRLKRYIGKPEGIIRMSLILGDKNED